MKLQVEGSTEQRAAYSKPVAKEVGKPGSIRRLARLVSETSVAVCICCLGLHAEEQIPNDAEASQFISASQFTSYARPAATLLSVVALSTNLTVQELFTLPDDWRQESLLPSDSELPDLMKDSTVMLYRKRLASRSPYPVWARLGAGLGRIFPRDTFGRSRTNGAGVLDPDWLYLKMSFRF